MTGMFGDALFAGTLYAGEPDTATPPTSTTVQVTGTLARPVAAVSLLGADQAVVTGTLSRPVAAVSLLGADQAQVTASLPRPVASITIATAASVAGNLYVAGTLPRPTATVSLLDADQATIDAILPRPAATVSLLDVDQAVIAGTLPAPTANVTLATDAVNGVTIDATLPSPIARVVIDTAPTTPVFPGGGRIRRGLARGYWDPPIVEPPARVAYNARRATALAYTGATRDANGELVVAGGVRAQMAQHRYRIVIAGVDVTYFRGAQTPYPSYGLIEPLGYGSGSITFPQIAGFIERPGHGPELGFLHTGAPITIQRVTRTGGVIATDFRGILLKPTRAANSVSFDFSGDVTGRAATQDKQPPIFKGRADLGYWWDRAIKGLHRPTGGPVQTGINLYDTGGQGLLDYLNDLGAQGVNLDGTQWTCMPDDDGTYRIARKDVTTKNCTLYLDNSLAIADLSSDPVERPNRIFATGVTPDGLRIKNGVYPALAAAPAPNFPNFDGRPIHPGDTDADTDLGGGVTALIAGLYAHGYLSAGNYTGGYDDDAEDAVKELQGDANLTQTGSVNPATWDALFDVGVTGYNLAGSHIEPMAQRDAVRRYNRNPSGAIIGPNPDWDIHRLVVDRSVDMGTGISRSRMSRWSHALMPSDDAWTGSIVVNGGAVIRGEHTPGDPLTQDDLLDARAVRPGWNVWLPLFEGGTLMHVSAVDVSAGTVTLTVDTEARDSRAAWEVLARNAANRKDPARAFIRATRSSGITKDQVTEWEEYGGVITPTDLQPGWNIIPVVAGQAGQIAGLHLQLFTPAEFVVAVFGYKISAAHLQNIIGNPLDHEHAKRWDDETTRQRLVGDYVLQYAAGDDQSPCGYYPGQKQVKKYTPMVDNPDYNVSVPTKDPKYDDRERIPEKVPNPDYDPGDPSKGPETIDKVLYDELTPLTGEWYDDAGFPYRTFRSTCVLFMAVYVLHGNRLKGGRIMDVQTDAS